MENIKNVSNETLLQWYANAKETAGCISHYKGLQNDALYLKYALELRDRGISVPKNFDEWLMQKQGLFVINVEIPKGISNGVGSF